MTPTYEINAGCQHGDPFYDVVEVREGNFPLHIQSYQTEGGAKVAIKKLMGETFHEIDNPTIESLQVHIVKLQAYIAELESYLK